MIQVLLYPDALSLVGSMNAFEIYNDSKTDVVFALRYQGAEQNIVQHTYTPNDEHRITVDVKDIILPLLAFELKDDSTPYIQENIMKAFSVEIYEVGDAGNKKEFSFSVIRSGVDKLADSAENFLKNNFLTWQPQVKAVTYYSPEFLTYYAAEACAVKCKAYLWNGTGYTESEITLAHLTEGCVYTIPVQYAIIAKALNQKAPSYYDVWVEKEGGDRLTYVQRYYASDMKSEEEEWFLFENSLGGVDCFRAYGNSENTAEHTHNVAEIEDDSEEYRVDTTRKFKKNTGYLDGKERLWLLDFFPSLGKYVYHRNSWRKITVTESDVNYEAKELPSNYTFTYRYSDARPYLNLSRVSGESLKQMDIHLPDIGNFTIAPRLVEFPRQQLGGGVLFPVQDPHSEEWGTTTADAIFSAFLSAISNRYSGKGEVGHKHINISVLDALSFIGGYLLYKGEKLKAGVADVAKELDGEAAILKKYIRRDIDDTAEGLITFLQGVKFGKEGDYFIEENGKASLRDILANTIKATTISTGNNFYFDANGDFKFDADGNIIAHSIASEDANETEEKGFMIARKDDTGKYKLCVDELLAWGLATVKQLHVKGDSTFDGNLFSKQFISDFLTGKGWGIYNKPILNAAGVQENKWTGEFDNVIVRGSLRVYEMIISQLLGENDNRVFTGMMEVDHYDAESGKVYLDTQDGKLYNPFRKDDIIMVQQFNGMPSKENDYYVTKTYELLITDAGCGSLDDGDKRLDWVTFTNFASSMEDASPEKLIKKKDTFVRVDNLSDPDRKGIMQVVTVGTATPHLDVIYGLKTDPEGALKGRLGNLEGIVHPWFGKLQGFGEYLNNLYAVGDLILRRTGESVDTKFQVLENMFSTRFAKTSYELTNGQNYLENGQFIEQVTDAETPIIASWEINTDDETMFWVDASGVPFMVNSTLTTSGNKKVALEQNDGGQMLRIQNCGLTQKNAIIRQPGTHKEYVKGRGEKNDAGLSQTETSTVDVQDKLYVNVRLYAKTAGQLTYGFEGCKAVEGKLNELAVKTENIAYSGEWQTVRMEGKWNGTGDFIIRYSGDCNIALVTITDEPLSEFSKTVSTQIVQTAENIKLLGENINKVNGKTTKLGFELDAEKGEIRQYVDQTDKKNREDTSSLIVQTSSSITSSVDKKLKDQYDTVTSEYTSSISQTAEGIRQWVGRQDYANNTTVSSSIDQLSGRITSTVEMVEANASSITQIQQDIDSITLTVGKAATQEQLQANVDTLNKNISSNFASAKSYADGVGSGIRSDYSSTITIVKQNSSSWSVAAGGFDSKGKLKSSAGAVLTTEFAGLFSTAFTNKGGVVKSEISSFITKDAAGKMISNAKISADNIVLSSGGSAVEKAIANAKNAGDTAQRTASNAAQAASNAQSTANTAVNNAKAANDAAAAAKSYAATEIQATNKSISALAGKVSFDSSGNITNISKSGLVTESNYASIFSYYRSVTGAVVQSEIKTFINRDEVGNIVSNATIQADKINLTGHCMNFSGGQITITTPNFKLDSTGSIWCQNGTFSGTVTGVNGSFKTLNCVDSNGNVVGNIQFGSDGRMWFSGDIYHQGYDSAKKRGYRFYAADIWCRGMFGHRQKTMALVFGTHMRIYTKDADNTEDTGVYIALESGMVSGRRYYKIPLYGFASYGDASGMAIDIVVINCSSDFYYVFEGMGNGKEWRVINGNDKQTIHFADIGGWHELKGGESLSCAYVNPKFLNPKPTSLGAGVFWSGEYDLNWS